jgi:hypothetical protein
VAEGASILFRAYVVEGLGDQVPSSMADLKRTELRVLPEVTLLSIREKTEQELSVDLGSIHWIFLTDPIDDDPQRRRQAYHLFVAVGSDGAFCWPLPDFSNVEVGDVERARHRGFFDGDPHTVLFDTRPYGNGAPVYLEETLEWLQLIGGAGAGVYVLRAAAKALFNLFRHHFQRWNSRGAMSPNAVFFTVLSKASWDPGELANYLGLSLDEVALLLDSLGYKDSEGVFYRTDDSEGAALRGELIREFLWTDPIEAVKVFDEISRKLEEDEGT